MRKNLVEQDLIECVIGIGKNLFYNSPMEACIVICRKNKSIERKNKILFIDAKNEVTRKNSESYLEKKHVNKILKAYNEYETIDGFATVATMDIIKDNDCKLSVAKYVLKDTSGDIKHFDESYSKWENCSLLLVSSIEKLLKSISL